MLMRVQEKLSYEDPDRKLYHLCIVNLVIGTLYCAKGNYEFGIGRIMKSLEPYQRKVCVCVCVLGQLRDLYACHLLPCHWLCHYYCVIVAVLASCCHSCHSAQLGTDTWYYAKRCLLSLLEYMVRAKWDPTAPHWG